MHTSTPSFLAALLAVGQTTAYSIPSNIQSFYSSIVSAGECSNKLQSGFAALQGESKSPHSTPSLPHPLSLVITNPQPAFSYCGDHLADYGVIYLQGTNGALADMDIDCDGLQGGPGDDGRCGSSSDTQ